MLKTPIKNFDLYAKSSLWMPQFKTDQLTDYNVHTTWNWFYVLKKNIFGCAAILVKTPTIAKTTVSTFKADTF